MTKIAIVGSRGLDDSRVEAAIEKALETESRNGLVIISGGAAGVDRIAEDWAKRNKIAVHVIRPDWQTNGMAAGYLRNTDIVLASDRVLAIWDGQSKGTADTVRKAHQYDRPVEVVKMKPMVEETARLSSSRWYMLSPIAFSGLVFDGIPYDSAEAAFWGYRAEDKEDSIRISRMSPATAKHEGPKPKAREGWNREMAITTMEDILIARMNAKPALRKILAETGSSMIVNDVKGSGQFWGYDTHTRIGANQIGLILMRIRERSKVGNATAIAEGVLAGFKPGMVEAVLGRTPEQSRLFQIDTTEIVKPYDALVASIEKDGLTENNRWNFCNISGNGETIPEDKQEVIARLTILKKQAIQQARFESENSIVPMPLDFEYGPPQVFSSRIGDSITRKVTPTHAIAKKVVKKREGFKSTTRRPMSTAGTGFGTISLKYNSLPSLDERDAKSNDQIFQSVKGAGFTDAEAHSFVNRIISRRRKQRIDNQIEMERIA